MGGLADRFERNRRGRRVEDATRLELLEHAAHQLIEFFEGKLAFVLADDPTVRVDEDQGRPGTTAKALPDREVTVVHHRVLDSIAQHRFPQIGRFPLGRELGRMHPDDDHPVAVFPLDLPQLRKGMHAIDSAERPEIDDPQPTAEIGQAQWPGDVEPVQPWRKVGGGRGPGIGTNGHPAMVRAAARVR